MVISGLRVAEQGHERLERHAGVDQLGGVGVSELVSSDLCSGCPSGPVRPAAATASRKPRWIRVGAEAAALLDEDEVGEVGRRVGAGSARCGLSLVEPFVEGFEGVVVERERRVRC